MAAIALIGIIFACGQVGTALAGDGASLSWDSMEVDILGWTAIDESPEYVTLKDGERLVGVSYFAVNQGEDVYGFTMSSIKLRDGDGELYRIGSATSLLSPGSRGEPLLPGEPHRGTLWFKVPQTAKDFSLVLYPGKKAEQSTRLADKPGVVDVSGDRMKITPPGVAVTASLEGWTLTVITARPIESIGDRTPGPDELAIAVDILAENVSGDARKLDLIVATRLKTLDGRVLGFVGLEAGTADVLLEVAAGGSVELSLGYLVPDPSGPLFLMFDPDAYETGKVLIALPMLK